MVIFNNQIITIITGIKSPTYILTVSKYYQFKKAYVTSVSKVQGKHLAKSKPKALRNYVTWPKLTCYNVRPVNRQTSV